MDFGSEFVYLSKNDPDKTSYEVLYEDEVQGEGALSRIAQTGQLDDGETCILDILGILVIVLQKFNHE